MMIGGMDKLYYYVRQMDRLLEPAMQNVVKLFSDPMMPRMELSKIKLTKADKEWLKREYNYFNLLFGKHGLTCYTT
jgi:hypothetical protein